jgi:hypothetical protein
MNAIAVGSKFVELAGLYIEKFPPGSGKYLVDKFDKWAESLPSEYQLPKLGDDHNLRNKHLQNRHDLKLKINSGGRCSLLEPNIQFRIEVIESGIWKTMPIFEATVSSAKTLSDRLDTIIKTKFSLVERLLRSNDLTLLTPQMQSTLDGCRDELEFGKDDIFSAAERIEKRVKRTLARTKAEIKTMAANGKDIGELKFILEYNDLPLLPKKKK